MPEPLPTQKGNQLEGSRDSKSRERIISKFGPKATKTHLQFRSPHKNVSKTGYAGSSSFQMKYTKSSFPYGVSPMKDSVSDVAGDIYEGFKGFAEGSKYSLTKGVRRGIDRYKKSKASRTPAGNMKVYGKSGATEK